MRMRQRVEAAAKPLVVFFSSLCAVGAVAAAFVVLVRVPALASTRLDVLFGTLQGSAVCLLFVTTGLLINLTAMVYRVTHPSPLPPVGDGGGEYLVQGRELYLWLPAGISNTPLGAWKWDRLLGVAGTGRNWNTVVKLGELSGGSPTQG